MTRRPATRTTGLIVLTFLAALGAGPGGPGPFGPIDGLTLAKPEDKVDAPPTPAPPGATVLFDGSSLKAWQKARGGQGVAAAWPLVEGGVMQVGVGTGDIATAETFDGHIRLHVEFRCPYLPDKSGQGRGNSGVYLQGRYEVQVLDSYGLKSRDNDCGGIYKVAVPAVNACKAPTVWQAYDIDFRAPIFEGGKKREPARISVRQNGVAIHSDVAIPLDNTVSGLGGDPSRPGPILLQDHGNPVQFRNIWVQRLAD